MTIFSHAFKSGITGLFLTFSFVAFGQDAEREILDHRKKQEAEFKDKSKSPLLPKERRKFKHLNYYPIDLKYRVIAQFVKTETPELFKMKTTTERLPDYRKYGEVHFEIAGESFTLEVYQSPDIMK